MSVTYLQPPMTIGGQAVDGACGLDVVNPATEHVIGTSPICTPEQLDAAMAFAERAFRSTWSSDEDSRRSALLAVADVLRGHSAELGTIVTTEQGRPLAEAIREVAGCASWFEYYAKLELPDTVIQDNQRAHVTVRRRPIGVVAAIAPWNYPLMLACWKLAPALRAGNTVVLKPSPLTPLSTLRMGQLLAPVLPAGVLNVVSGADDLGARVSRHPAVRKISFTGSTAVGMKVAQAAAADLKRVTLELGGNDPAIILDDDDANVDEIARHLFDNAFQNAGQVCCAVKRVYAPRRLAGHLVDALAELARGVNVGDGADPQTHMGPLVSANQRDRLAALVEDAVHGGARVAVGGSAPQRPGYFYSPTVVFDVDDRAALVTEEQFGPALPVLTYRDEADAIAAANTGCYGLGGSVWSTDPQRARLVADQLECGSVWINAHKQLAPHIPFGGIKHSGIGTENGPWGLEEYLHSQVLYDAR